MTTSTASPSLTDLVTPANSTTFTWDPNGNQLTKTVGTGQPTEYRYDIRDKLVETVQGPSTLGRFQYDFQGRRNQKIGEDGVKQYVYDQTSVLAEYDEAGIQKAKYDYGSDRLISLFRTDEGRRYFHLDGLRSVVNLTDDAGCRRGQLPPRRPSASTASRRSSAPSKNRFGFTGYEWDPETGLYNAKARYFDPQLGRFLTPGLLPRPDRRAAEPPPVLLRERQPHEVHRPYGPHRPPDPRRVDQQEHGLEQ